MAKPEQNCAFTLRLGDNADAKLKKLAKAHGRSKTWMVEALILAADDSPERLARIEARRSMLED